MSDRLTDDYREVYSDAGLAAKLGRFAHVAGRELVERAILLYLVMRDEHTPRWAKATVIGALGYFIAPLDAIPDLLPGVGFTDDLSVIVAALAAVASSITPGMRAEAARLTARWFGARVVYHDVEGTVVETEASLVSREPR